MKTIAFDVMGGDGGMKPAIDAALKFTKENIGFSCILVGDQNELKKYAVENERISFLHSPDPIPKEVDLSALRNDKSSMTDAIKLVKNGTADAVISAGNSGAYLTLTTLHLKRIKGIQRPAFMPIFPTVVKDKKLVMLDVGANLEPSAEMISQWARLASVFSQKVLNVGRPKVMMLNIGTEENKGLSLHTKAHELLLNDASINYDGFIEPRDLLEGVADVIVSDGYGGNLALKTLEGTFKSLMSLIKTSLKSKFRYMIGAMLAKGGFKIVKDTLDHRNVGGAWIIGLNHLAVKAHGSSDKKAFNGALKQLAFALNVDALERLKESV